MVREIGRWVRRRLIAGLIVIAPVAVTLYVLYWLFSLVDGIIGTSLYNAIGFEIPGLGLVVLLGLLLLVGWLTEKTVGGQIVEWWHRALDRVPVVSRLYGATRRIIGSVFGGEGRRFFRDVVLFQYPARGQWTLGFVTGPAPDALGDRMANGVTIFLPTAPNPVTGFLIIVPEDEVIRLPVTIEEGFTYILSAGAVAPGKAPPGPAEQAAVAEAGRAAAREASA